MSLSVAALAGTGSAAATGKGQSIEAMDGMDFLKLLITELSSQDPFEPMKNKEILEQLSAIRSLEANMTLSENIQSMVTNQELTSATVLIGRIISGVDTGGELVEGTVERIVLDATGIRVQVGDREIVRRRSTRIGRVTTTGRRTVWILVERITGRVTTTRGRSR